MVNQKENRLGEERYSNQGCLMKVVEYNQYRDIVVEFQDEYKARVHTNYQCFLFGKVKNPYYPSVYSVGTIGIKHPVSINCKAIKEYKVWSDIIQRCYDEKFKNKRLTYKNATCCEEWLLYENFYEWLHSQENFNKWISGELWAIDKDILVKGNKVYSPEACCLVPSNVNVLFTKNNICRGNLPIGVAKYGERYIALCNNPFTNKQDKLGVYSTPEDAFRVYKKYKENLIKQVAEIEFNKGNITEQCYNAMMNYEVEITD